MNYYKWVTIKAKEKGASNKLLEMFLLLAELSCLLQFYEYPHAWKYFEKKWDRKWIELRQIIIF